MTRNATRQKSHRRLFQHHKGLSRKHSTRIQTILLAMMLNMAALTWNTAQAQSLTRGPYLQMQGHNSITVCFQTDQASAGWVKYGTNPQNLTQTATGSSVSEHRVAISGLNPNTQYYYSIGTGTTTLSGPDSLHRFRTAPVPGTVQPIRTWVIGDFGKGNPEQAEVRNAFLSYNAGAHVDNWLWLGDNAYSDGTQQEFQQKVFSGNGYPDEFKWLPFMTCPGNHDYGSINSLSPPLSHTGPYYDIVETPEQGELGGVASGNHLYYSFDYGNVHYISLNSEIQLYTVNGNSPMAQWLENDLKANTKPWIIVFFHKPPYSKGSHDSDEFWEIDIFGLRSNYLPILEQYGADLVLTGHSHVYERSYLINGHYDNSSTFDANQHLVSSLSGNLALNEPYLKDSIRNEGTVYAVVGNSASKDSDPKLNHPVMYAGYGCDTCVGSMVIDVNGDTLTGTFIDKDAVVRDQFTIIKTSIPVSTQPKVNNPVSNLTARPNPFREELTIDFTLTKAATVKLELLDTQGKRVWKSNRIQKPAGTHSRYLRTTDLNLVPGVYYLRIVHEGSPKLTRLLHLEQ